MDHTPGQGQYKSAGPLIDYYRKAHHLSEESIATLLEKKISRRESHAEKNILHFADLARKNNIPIASHDDDSAEKVIFGKSLGTVISEFPVNHEAVRAASGEGLLIVLGSPNIMRGYSHNGNLSAREILRQGYGDIVCSDYLPMSLVHALFTIVDNEIGSLPEASCLFSKNPAGALGLSSERGSIEPGKEADMILISRKNEVPAIIRTWVSGNTAFSRGIGN
jgi:alpha-D-ribose 1-methylphosphonate 5-triphosphate diphosphatase